MRRGHWCLVQVKPLGVSICYGKRGRCIGIKIEEGALRAWDAPSFHLPPTDRTCLRHYLPRRTLKRKIAPKRDLPSSFHKINAMSTNNLARFYWTKLERADAMFEDGKHEGAGEICLQLVNDFECPRYVQVDS
jgi:hypothetical protein